MRLYTKATVLGVVLLLLFIGGIALSDGGHGKNVDKILAEIREVLGLETDSRIDPDRVSNEHLEELGEAVMDIMHPNEREHELMDEMMGGEGSESLEYMHRMMGYRYLSSGFRSPVLPMMGGRMGMGMMGGVPTTGWGMHHGWGRGNYGVIPGRMMGGFWGFYTWRIIMWIILLGVIGVVIWLVVRSQKQGGTFRNPEVDSPLEIAKQRYAKGEISREEFETMKRDLQ
jgi:uncharacterized membrane protein